MGRGGQTRQDLACDGTCELKPSCQSCEVIRSNIVALVWSGKGSFGPISATDLQNGAGLNDPVFKRVRVAAFRHHYFPSSQDW